MNKCPKCDVDIMTNTNICPLCHNKIVLKEKNSIYPKVNTKYHSHELLIKILLSISVFKKDKSIFSTSQSPSIKVSLSNKSLKIFSSVKLK